MPTVIGTGNEHWSLKLHYGPFSLQRPPLESFPARLRAESNPIGQPHNVAAGSSFWAGANSAAGSNRASRSSSRSSVD